jgi:hypothetical protein
MLLPEKIFNKGDIVILKESNKNSGFYRPDKFRIVSYSLIYIDFEKVPDGESPSEEHEEIIHERELEYLGRNIQPLRWLINVQSEETGKRVRHFYEGHFEISVAGMRDKKIKELIEV